VASKQIEQEIDQWVEKCPLKRRSIMNRPKVIKDSRYYEKTWRHVLKEMENQKEIDKCVNAFK
jgi:hypothetical protein